MPRYKYKIITGEGKVVESEGLFNSEVDAQREIASKSKHILYIKEVKTTEFSFFANILSSKRISAEELLIFTQELIALLRAGITFEKGMEIILRRKRGTFFEEVLEDVRKNIVSGYSVSEAWKDYEDKLPPVFIPSLKAGEQSGNMVEVLERFIRYIKTIHKIRAKLQSAIIYPTILIGFTTVLVVVLVTFVMPKFTNLFTKFGSGELPTATNILMTVSRFVSENLALILLVAAGGVISYLYVVSTDKGRIRIDYFKTKIPLIKEFVIKSGASQILRTLGIMLAGGIPMVDSLKVAVIAVSNRYIAQRVTEVVQDIKEGNPLSYALEKTEVFPDIALELTTVGENSGKLKEMLFTISDFYDDEIDRNVERMLSAVEPILIVFMGLIVAGILLTIYVPLYSVTQSIMKTH